MKLLRFLVMVAAFAATSMPARSMEVDVASSVELKASSAFVWRGEIINDDWCFQPRATLGISNLILSVWGNWDMTSVSNASTHRRIDVKLDYSREFESHLFSAGIVSYIYNDNMWQQREDTFEVYMGEALKNVFLMPAVMVYYDFGELDGFYGTFSLQHSFSLFKDPFQKDMLALDLKAMIGAADSKYIEGVFGYPADPESGMAAFDPSASLVDFTASATLPFWRRDDLIFTPGVKYMTLVDSEIRQAAEHRGQDKDIVYYTFAVEFLF